VTRHVKLDTYRKHILLHIWIENVLTLKRYKKLHYFQRHSNANVENAKCIVSRKTCDFHTISFSFHNFNWFSHSAVVFTHQLLFTFW